MDERRKEGGLRQRRCSPGRMATGNVIIGSIGNHMAGWGEGYVTEVEFGAPYFNELAPLRAAFALAYQGIDAVLPAAPVYLELAIGQGLSLAVHAAANPGEFWGMDFNPAHLANARDLAAGAAIDVNLAEDSFAEFALRHDLPAFDMIGLTGVWSWISPANRSHIVEILRRHLKPGGIVCLSYAAAPGWVPSQPLQHILALHAARAGSPAAGPVANLEAAIEFTENLVASGSLFFKDNPSVVKELQVLREGSLRSRVHEWLNEHCFAMAFSETASELAAAKLSFGASASFFHHVPAFHLMAEGQALIDETQDVVLRETIRDFLVNRQSRQDYFVKGGRRLAAAKRLERLRRFNVVLSRRPQDIELKVKTTLGDMSLDADVYRPLIDALAETTAIPTPIADLEVRVGTSGVSLDKLLEAIVVLLSRGEVELAHDEATMHQVAPRTRALNQWLIDSSPLRRDIKVLASPLTGTGIRVSRFGPLFLRSWQGGKKDAGACMKETWALLANDIKLSRQDGFVESEAKIARKMAFARTFPEKMLPVLKSLGIV
jgi:SAM-dependent methyltransferase